MVQTKKPSVGGGGGEYGYFLDQHNNVDFEV